MASICNMITSYLPVTAFRCISRPVQVSKANKLQQVFADNRRYHNLCPENICQQALTASCCIQIPWQHIQVRGRYTNWQMLRDVKRRACVKEHAKERLRINALRRNTILPPVIQEMATKEMQKFPADSNQTRLVKRCVMTSRPRSVRKHWRLSRIMWRHLADYNKLSGITRSSW